MVTARMSEELRLYVLADEAFTAPESTLESIGFRRCVDYPDLPSHIYYEG
jgi:hypothetical protein